MRLIITSIFILMLVVNGSAQRKRELFRGGMMLHAGYMTNQLNYPEIKGLCTGIGGKIVFPVMKHLRIGTEGYVSNYNYPESEGFFKLGWGGLLCEYQIWNKRFTPVIGVTVGGGKIRDLYPHAGDYTDNIVDAAIYKTYSTMVIAPQISFEYKVTDHINLACKFDYVLFPGNDYPEFIAKGPRGYIGVLFSR